MESYDYVTHIEGNKYFYIPNLFKFNNHYYDFKKGEEIDEFFYHFRYKNLLTYDIVKNFYKNKQIHLNYYKYQSLDNNIFFINNHPLNCVSISGFVQHFKIRSINKKEFIVIKIDDNSVNDHFDYLSCKISVEKFRTLNLFNSNRYESFKKLHCKKVRIFGSVNSRCNEFDIEYIKLIDEKNSLIDECEHWKSCIENRHELYDNNWVVDSSILKKLLFSNRISNEKDISNDSEEANSKQESVFETKNRKYKSLNYYDDGVECNYIETLQYKDLRNEIEITSPYASRIDKKFNPHVYLKLREEQTSHENMEDGENPGKCLPVDLVLKPQVAERIACESVESRDALDEESGSKGIARIPETNSKKYNNILLKILLFDCEDLVSTDYLLKLLKLQKLDGNTENITIPKLIFAENNDTFSNKFSHYEFTLLKEYLVDLQKIELIRVNNAGDTMDLNNLHRLFSYCHKHCKLFINLKYNTVTINHSLIKKKLDIHKVPDMVIINIYRESIKNFVNQNPRLLKSWFIEVNANRSSILYLKYPGNVDT
ncbi:hypothetical protein TPHA_0A02030 [Tetrapisispora phaffii CBS 4417]|uniref:CST complex subunit Stn1 N-terminal domain-containing protein n=1 Tax=Tetrapisispora phaffii (strain ATCC 24235 / CBS 4417 / NBRC 1672 / NRRL Y-8282 / UCD 70-5) TaxID=1071381 RepID=G8BN07_TETPH|nr:hypothetical protein TPHA_0A02030 [Tetrapisispora phaffii CBS 4417]CCE61285.1 hypothetical protein TPHA_0A02030 [Tetrapisispora phaffii CBS 4417]